MIKTCYDDGIDGGDDCGGRLLCSVGIPIHPAWYLTHSCPRWPTTGALDGPPARICLTIFVPPRGICTQRLPPKGDTLHHLPPCPCWQSISTDQLRKTIGKLTADIFYKIIHLVLSFPPARVDLEAFLEISSSVSTTLTIFTIMRSE